jgi:hypothetical protein
MDGLAPTVDDSVACGDADVTPTCDMGLSLPGSPSGGLAQMLAMLGRFVTPGAFSTTFRNFLNIARITLLADLASGFLCCIASKRVAVHSKCCMASWTYSEFSLGKNM